MNLYVVLFLSLLMCSCSDTMDLKKLGSVEFSKEVWAQGSQETRGQMVYSLSKRYTFKGMNNSQVIAILGESKAYYEYDEFLAYLVGPKDITSEFGEGYVLAFPIDRDSGLIRGLVISPPL